MRVSVSSSVVADFAADATLAIREATYVAIAEEDAAAARATSYSNYFFASAADAMTTSADVVSWDQVMRDQEQIKGGGELINAPLWSGNAPDWFDAADYEMREIWDAEGSDRWGFWTRWWDGVLSGKQLDWDLQRRVALIPEDIWQQGPDAVAGRIREIEDEIKALPRDPSVEIERSLRTGLAPAAEVVMSVQNAMAENRKALPPTFDAIEGLLALEIEREQSRNYVDDLDLAEARRRIGVLLALHEAVLQLRQTVPAVGPVPVENAVRAEGLLRFYASKFAELPRARADEVVEGVWGSAKGLVSVGLVMGSGAMAGYLGLPVLGGMVAGSMVFAPKSSADIIKAAKEYLVSPSTRPGA